MMAYDGGDGFPCVVADVGSYATKMGFAGEDYPRSYFRSTTAINRDQDNNSGNSKNNENEKNRFHCSSRKFKRSYDFFTRRLEYGKDDVDHDGDWEVCNPIDDTTGLVYQGLNDCVNSSMIVNAAATPSSMNSNDDGNNDVEMQDVSGNNPSTATPRSSKSPPASNQPPPPSSPSSPHSQFINSESNPGECYIHFSSHLAHGYKSALCKSPSTTPLLLIEKSYNPPPIRQKMMEIVFEEHDVPATFFARDAVCACYAVGRTTGTVADVGHCGTVVTPVYDGFVENKGILRSPVGTRMMHELVLENLDGLYKTKKARMKLKGNVDYVRPIYQLRGMSAGAGAGATTTGEVLTRREPFHSLARLDVARMCMESGSGAGVAAFGYAALHDFEPDPDAPEGEEQEPGEVYQQYANAPKSNYKLPDGTTVDIAQTKRFDVAELMFGKGGKSAKMREVAATRMRKHMDAIIASAGDPAALEDADSSAIAQMEEMSRRKRNARIASSSPGDKKKNKRQSQSSLRAGHEKLVKACTPYLSTSIGELTASTLPSMICDSAFRCDRDQQSQLLGNTILCGGGACLATSVTSTTAVNSKGTAMPERIRQECEAIIHAHTPGWRVKVLSPGLTERAVCSWLGGSILGSLGSFHDMWITKADYEEHGAAIVNRKCP